MTLRTWRRESVLFLVALAIVAADQISKQWAIQNLRDGRIIHLVGEILRLRYTTNTGAAFGLFQDQGTVLAVIALVVVSGILLYYRRLPELSILVRISLGLQLGGAIGNLADRLLRGGSVVDFVEIVLWPIFNIADAAVVLGVAILAYYLLFFASDEELASTAEAHQTADADSLLEENQPPEPLASGT